MVEDRKSTRLNSRPTRCSSDLSHKKSARDGSLSQGSRNQRVGGERGRLILGCSGLKLNGGRSEEHTSELPAYAVLVRSQSQEKRAGWKFVARVPESEGWGRARQAYIRMFRSEIEWWKIGRAHV